MSPYYRYFSEKPPTCPRCDTRVVLTRSNGQPGECCRECRAAEQALQYYWRRVGTPLITNEHRRWLTPIPPSITRGAA